MMQIHSKSIPHRVHPISFPFPVSIPHGISRPQIPISLLQIPFPVPHPNPSSHCQSHSLIPLPNRTSLKPIPSPIPYSHRLSPEAPPPSPPLGPAPGLSLLSSCSGPARPGLSLLSGSAAGSDWLRRSARERPLAAGSGPPGSPLSRRRSLPGRPRTAPPLQPLCAGAVRAAPSRKCGTTGAVLRTAAPEVCGRTAPGRGQGAEPCAALPSAVGEYAALGRDVG